MSKIVALESDAQLPELLEMVARGESVTLTREGDAVAKIVPAASPARMSTEEAVRRLLEFRQEHRVSTEEFWEIVNDGRRD